MVNKPMILMNTPKVVFFTFWAKYNVTTIINAVNPIAIRIADVEIAIPYSAVKVIAVVTAAGPAIKGVATGTAARANIFFSFF